MTDIKQFFGSVRVRTQINPLTPNRAQLKLGFSVVAEQEVRRDDERFLDDLRVCRAKLLENLRTAAAELEQAMKDVP